MKIKINGIVVANAALNYEQIHQRVEDNSYHSVGELIMDKIQHTEWYHREPKNFDLVENFNDVKAICNHNLDCYVDSLNWSIMNKTELTKDIYKFIIDREYVIRHGFKENFLPKHINFDHILNLIDWEFLLDCISWFF